MKKEVSLCWFRRDLRLEDNAALYFSLKSPYPVLPLFIFDPEILDQLQDKEDRRVSFILRKLNTMNSEFKKHDSSFSVHHEPVESAFLRLIEEFDIKEVFTNHDYEPYAISRDSKVKKLLDDRGIVFNSFKDQVIFEKLEVLKPDGLPYTVFTPYSKRWKQKYQEGRPESYPSEQYLRNLFKRESVKLPTINELGFEDIEAELQPPDLSEITISGYHNTRNLPAIKGTTSTSVSLRFGTLSIRELVRRAYRWNEQWLNELIWREFFMMILFNFPHVVHHSFKRKYDQIPWRNNESEFELWCKGETGYPIVDAGMRQLNETGWMHNRVRMIVAGFLTKHLLIDWRWGEAYFARKLLDYDLSSNNGNWQWAAGSGCDSAPYFRIFNPTAQTLKFDPKLVYIKTWIKDFNKYHLVPIVEHEFARKRALEVYKKALNEG